MCLLVCLFGRMDGLGAHGDHPHMAIRCQNFDEVFRHAAVLARAGTQHLAMRLALYFGHGLLERHGGDGS